MPAATFHAWVANSVITQVEEEEVHLAVPSHKSAEWLTQRLQAALQQALAAVLGREVRLVLAVRERGAPKTGGEGSK